MARKTRGPGVSKVGVTLCCALLTATCCVTLACEDNSDEEAPSSHSKDIALRRLRDLGAQITRTDDGTIVTIDSVAFAGRHTGWSGRPKDLEMLSSIGAIDSLSLLVSIDHPRDIAFLRDIPRLRHLLIVVRSGPAWTKDFTSSVVLCKNLESLHILARSLSAEAIEPIPKLSSLKDLRIISRNLSRTSILTICKLRQLERFDGILFDAGNEDIKHFLSLPRLQRLRVQGKGITDEGREWLANQHQTCSKVTSLVEAAER